MKRSDACTCLWNHHEGGNFSDRLIPLYGCVGDLNAMISIVEGQIFFFLNLGKAPNKIKLDSSLS